MFEPLSTDWVPGVMLYRRAVAAAHQAEQRQSDYARTRDRERRFREIDYTIETVILAQAAAEGWIHAAYRAARKEPVGKGWCARWSNAPTRIAGPGARALTNDTTETLDWLSAWRNYLVHDDTRARRQIGRYVQPGAEPDQLTASLAREVIDRVDLAFADIGKIIGSRSLQAPNSFGLWVPWEEQ